VVVVDAELFGSDGLKEALVLQCLEDVHPNLVIRVLKFLQALDSSTDVRLRVLSRNLTLRTPLVVGGAKAFSSSSLPSLDYSEGNESEEEKADDPSHGYVLSTQNGLLD